MIEMAERILLKSLVFVKNILISHVSQKRSQQSLNLSSDLPFCSQKLEISQTFPIKFFLEQINQSTLISCLIYRIVFLLEIVGEMSDKRQYLQ